MPRSTHNSRRADPESITYRTSSVLSEDPEQPRPSRPPTPDHVEEEGNAPPPAEEVTRLRFLAHYGGLVLASMIGSLIRLGLEALTTYDGQIVYSLAWVQGVGCGIMGLALSRKNEIVWLYPPLYTFFTTGIAGSITTFSSWMLEGYEAFSNFRGYNRGGLYDTVDGLAYSFSTLAISLSCLRLGEHISSTLSPLPINKTSLRSPKSSERYGRKTPYLDLAVTLSAATSYLIAILLYFFAPHWWRHPVLFPLLLSPPGAMLRFAFARLNPLPAFINRFPMGTLIVNIAATLIIAGSVSAQYTRSSAQTNAVTCNALYGIQQGFCGCLSTVSTFVVELRSIQGKRWKWGYLFGSVVLGHVCVLAVLGGVGWSQGYGPVCSG